MEIISCVQDTSYRRSFRIPNFQRKTRRNNYFNTSILTTNIGSFSNVKAPRDLSVKGILKSIGGTITKVQDFCSENSKKLLITISSIAAFALILTTSLGIYNYTANSIKPLQFESDALDIENLNKLMASFALEGAAEYDEDGNLLDTEGFTPQNFAQPVTYKNYTVKPGDTISGIAKKFGLTNLSTLISVNDIGNVRQLAAGQHLKVPSLDGIIYTVKAGDSINSIATKNNITLESLLDVNDLTTEQLTVGQQLFLPGVGLDQRTLRNAMGDLFKMPIAAPFRWTSMYGPRIDPIAGHKSFHTGVDMACPTGTPILASMSGRVTKTGVTRVYGNYVIIDHGNGYQTLYAHMSKIIAKQGQWVNQGTRIGLVGSTGYSTGPHLHFTVYKNGQLINPMSVLK